MAYFYPLQTAEIYSDCAKDSQDTPDLVIKSLEPLKESIVGVPPEDPSSKTRTGLPPVRHYVKLCGYLHKYATKGLLKTAKKRWFVFCESNCKLYYYRSSDAQLPLGEIDIGKATFSFDAVNKEKPGAFTISTATKDYVLEAKDREACLFWLQELQHWRKIYSKSRTQQVDGGPSEDKVLQGSGLLSKATPDKSDLSEDNAENFLLGPISQPEGVIGEESSHHNPTSRSVALAQQLCTQMINSVSSIKNSGRQDRVRPASVAFNTREEMVSGLTPEKEELSLSQENLKKKSSNLSKNKSPSLSSLRKKVQASFRSKRSSSEMEKFADDQRGKRQNEDSSCHKCKELEVGITSLKDDLSILEDELCTSKEVTQILHRQMELLAVERDTLMRVCEMTIPKTHLDLLREREHEIVRLNHELNKVLNELESKKRVLSRIESEVGNSQEQLILYQELLQEKDRVVVSLTNEVFELETEKQNQEQDVILRRPAGVIISNSPSHRHSVLSKKSSLEGEDIQSYKDALQAFEIQNKFLNKEILELNQLRRHAEERERNLILCCSEWEAKCYQTQSKLLFLLKELEKPALGSSDENIKVQDVVTRLLEEAMEENTSGQTLIWPAWSRDEEYDELGFSWKWGKEGNLLSTKANNLKQKSEGITNKLKDPEITSWKVKWENFMVNLGSRELQHSLDLKHLLRSGVPAEHRGRIWKGCVELRVKNLKRRLGDNYYENVLSSSTGVSRFDPAIKQIELDLLRTLPSNRHYETLDSDGIPKLRRVLIAYSRHNPAIGYCQGLNRLVAIALLFLDEEDSFWLLVAVAECILPSDYYSKTLIASQVDQRVLKDLLMEKLPRLHNHLEQNNVDLSLYTFSWFLTIFVDNIPSETYLRIWDIFLYEGSKVLFRYALAFFKMCETELLSVSDYMAINQCLRSFTENLTDIKRLTQIAFVELNPFPMRVIAAKRAHHLQLVQGQLDELDALRRSAEVQGGHHFKDDYFPSDED